LKQGLKSWKGKLGNLLPLYNKASAVSFTSWFGIRISALVIKKPLTHRVAICFGDEFGHRVYGRKSRTLFKVRKATGITGRCCNHWEKNISSLLSLF